MLEKVYDHVIIGDGPYSYLTGIELLQKGKKVLLLFPQDQGKRKMAFHGGTGPLTFFEKEYLKLWGEERGIAPLASIDQFLLPLDVYFHFDRGPIRLGQRASQNLMELIRKRADWFATAQSENPFRYFFSPHDIEEHGHHFSQEMSNFDRGVEDYSRTLAKRLYQKKNKRSLKISDFLADIPPVLFHLFKIFSSHRVSDSSLSDLKRLTTHTFEQFWDFKTFLFLSRSLFHRMPVVLAQEIELLLLIVQLFGPSYQLDSQQVEKELLKLFFAHGGQIKHAPVGDWDPSFQDHWRLELLSYDGVIHPKNLILLGHLLPHTSLERDPRKEYFHRFFWEMATPANWPEQYFHGHQLRHYSSHQVLGTECPLFSIYLGPLGIQGEIWWQHSEGQRASFFQHPTWNKIWPALKQLPFDFSFIDRGPFAGLQLFEPRSWPVWEKTNLGQHRAPPIISTREKDFGLSLDKLNYFGPEKYEIFGPFSTLLDIQQYLQSYPDQRGPLQH